MTKPEDQLSPEVIASIGKNMHPFDIFELAYCNTNWQKQIAACHVQINSFYISAHRIDGMTNVRLDLKIHGEMVHFFFYKKEKEQIAAFQTEPGTFAIRKIGKTDFTCRNTGTIYRIYTTDLFGCFYGVMELLFTIFADPINMFYIGPVAGLPEEVFLNLLEYKQVKRCVKLLVACTAGLSNRTKHVLLGMELNSVVMYDVSHDNFRFPEPMIMKSVHIGFAESLSRDCFFKMRVESMQLGGPNFTWNDINIFLRQWLHGTDRKLRRTTINFDSQTTNLGPIENLFVGLDVTKREKTKNRFFKFPESFNEVDCQDGYDFDRSDGAEATMVVEKKQFHFVIWSYPFARTVPSHIETVTKELEDRKKRTEQWVAQEEPEEGENQLEDVERVEPVVDQRDGNGDDNNEEEEEEEPNGDDGEEQVANNEDTDNDSVYDEDGEPIPKRVRRR